jgi:hypothetical protein
VTWQDLGSIGEFVSAIVVVISLVYVAHQIRQNTKQINQNTKAVRAAAIDSSVGHTMRIRTSIFGSADVARIFHAGNAEPQSLNPEELLRYRLIVHNTLASLANTFLQSRYAELIETWDAQVRITQRVLSTNGGRWFWSLYAQELDESFQREVHRICPDLASLTEVPPIGSPPAD